MDGEGVLWVATYSNGLWRRTLTGDFGIAAAMLQLLGQDAVRLLTNNPRKLAGLEAAGIRLVERIPLSMDAGTHTRAYLATKRERSGHLL